MTGRWIIHALIARQRACRLLLLCTLAGSVILAGMGPQAAEAKSPRRRAGATRRQSEDSQILRAVIGRNPSGLKWRRAPRPLPSTLGGDWERLAKHQTVGLAWYTLRRQGSSARVSVSALVGDSMHYDWTIVHLAKRNGRWVKTRTEEDEI